MAYHVKTEVIAYGSWFDVNVDNGDFDTLVEARKFIYKIFHAPDYTYTASDGFYKCNPSDYFFHIYNGRKHIESYQMIYSQKTKKRTKTASMYYIINGHPSNQWYILKADGSLKEMVNK